MTQALAFELALHKNTQGAGFVPQYCSVYHLPPLHDLSHIYTLSVSKDYQGCSSFGKFLTVF